MEGLIAIVQIVAFGLLYWIISDVLHAWVEKKVKEDEGK